MSQRRLKRKKNERLSLHHKIPISRGGLSVPNNIKWITEVKHRAWHTLFENMLPEEAIEHIKNNWS